MDIRKWLAETESPVRSERLGMGHCLLPRQPDPVPDTRRKRKRGSSDSSLLRAPSPQPQPQREGFPAIGRDSNHVGDPVERARSNLPYSAPSEFTGNNVVSQRYARKPRRKTRPDKYDAGLKRPKERDEGRHPGRKSELRQPKRRSKRRKDERTHNGIGQEFQARNVPKDRLTLKPLEKLGLFSKGRTSTSAKDRGLPDLVFSEMKFLQKDHGGKNHTAQASDAKDKRKKDHVRTKEESISAFFTSVRHRLADTDGNPMPESGHPLPDTSVATEANGRGRAQKPSNVSGTAVSTIESEGKASYPGFASRGPRAEGTSYFSLSESIHAPSITLVRPKSTSNVDSKRHGVSKREIAEVPHDRRMAVRQQISSSVRGVPTTATADRVRVFSAAPMPSGFLRSQSLPQRSSSPRRPNLVDRGANCHICEEDFPSPSSMLPVMQNRVGDQHQHISMTKGTIRTYYASDNAASAQKQILIDKARRLVPHDSLQQSGSLYEVMQHCNDVSQAGPRQVPSNRDRRLEARFPLGPPDKNQQANLVSYQKTARAPTVRFIAPDAQPSRLPNFSGSSLYAQQEHRQYLPAEFDPEESFDCQHADVVDQEYMCQSDLLYQQDFGGLPSEAMSFRTMEDFDDEVRGVGCVVDGVEQMHELEHTRVVGSGFWRPNRLY